MNLIDYIIITIASSIVAFIHFKSYKVLSNKKKFDLNFRNILIVFLCGIIITINTYASNGIYRAFLSYVLLLMADYVIFKDNFFKTFIYSAICYLFVVIFEVLLSVIIVVFNMIDLKSFDTNLILKTCFSLLTLLLSYLSCKVKLVQKMILKLYNVFNKPLFIIPIIIATLAIFIALAFKYVVTFSVSTYISNIILLVCSVFLIIITLYNNFKATKEVEKTETLLNFMSKYEKIIDEDRINRHEMLNNLLILKSFENKNTKKYENALDDFIKIYDKKGNDTIKNVYKLPSGLKGILYYKVREMRNNNIDVIVNISRQVVLPLENLNHQEYVGLCKIIGITMDNATEAAKESNEKEIFIDIYQIEKDINIIIENSFKNKVEVTKIKQKNYSTKSGSRGLGLYIANLLIKKSKHITMSQSINNNKFITKIIVK